jgi:hypothetical protein
MASTTARLQQAYAGEDTPLRPYGGLIAGFAVATGGMLVGAGRAGRLPERVAVYDIALGALAAQRLSRLLAKDRVGAVLRAPLTRYQGRGRPGEVEETPRRGGAGLALGQLVVCPYCLDQWAALAFVSGLVVAPRATRAVAATLAVGSLSDILQAAYAAFVPAGGGDA